jgi:predicted  nucleic acid-binding Zn-ribbon protein
MDAMALAQLKRQLAWHAEETHHINRDLQSAELALENAKKKVEELKKKLIDSKRKLEQFNHDITTAEEEARRKIANDRR